MDNMFMTLAVEQAKIALERNEVPVGAVIVKNGEVLFSSYNKKNLENVAVFHAEILCIIGACKKLNSWHLDGCELYVTLKPCDMCLYALAEARVSSVYYLLDNNYNENLSSNYNKIECTLIPDIYKYSTLLGDFFSDLRK